jgi:hypothetical protein
MTDTEELLRAGMARFARDVIVPPGLPDRAVRHLRRRKAAVAAVVTASLTAVTVAAVVLSSAGPAPGPGVQPAAYVLARTEGALAQISQQNLIQAISETTNIPRVSISAWTYHDDERLTEYGPDGRPTADNGDKVIGNREIFTDVNYDRRTWDRWTYTLHPVVTPTSVPTCDPALTENIVTPGFSDWATIFRDALRCGIYQVAGTDQVDGVHLFKLTPVHPIHQRDGGVIQTVYWIDPVTYLPVRAQLTVADTVETETFRWLPPTTANLKSMDVPIPAGFTRVPPPPAP